MFLKKIIPVVMVTLLFFDVVYGIAMPYIETQLGDAPSGTDRDEIYHYYLDDYDSSVSKHYTYIHPNLNNRISEGYVLQTKENSKVWLELPEDDMVFAKRNSSYSVVNDGDDDVFRVISPYAPRPFDSSFYTKVIASDWKLKVYEPDNNDNNEFYVIFEPEEAYKDYSSTTTSVDYYQVNNSSNGDFWRNMAGQPTDDNFSINGGWTHQTLSEPQGLTYILERCGDGIVQSDHEECDPEADGWSEETCDPETCQTTSTNDTCGLVIKSGNDHIGSVVGESGEEVFVGNDWITVPQGSNLTFECSVDEDDNVFVGAYTGGMFLNEPVGWYWEFGCELLFRVIDFPPSNVQQYIFSSTGSVGVSCGSTETQTRCRAAIRIEEETPPEEPSCVFNAPDCGIEANEEETLDATISGLEPNTNIRLVVTQGGTTEEVWVGTYTSAGTYTATFNLSDEPIGAPPVLSNPSNFEWQYVLGSNWQAIPDENDNNCSASVAIRPRCEDFTINGTDDYQGYAGDDIEFLCTGLYGDDALVEVDYSGFPNNFYSINDGNANTRTGRFLYGFDSWTISGGLVVNDPYTATCTISPVEILETANGSAGVCDLENTCTATLTIQEPDQPLCSSAYSGAYIYDLDNDGGYLDGSENLCDMGSVNGFEYNENTDTRSWECEENGDAVSCEAYEDSCGDGDLNGPAPATSSSFPYDYYDTIPSGYDTGEQCDDGGTENGDGCSAQCLLETPDCNVTVDYATPPFAPLEVNFTVDSPDEWDGGTVKVVSGYYTGFNNQFPINYPTQRNGSHTYNIPGFYERGFYIQNNLAGIYRDASWGDRPGRRCTGDIEVLDVPDVYIEKFQRNETQDIPPSGFTGDDIQLMSGDEIVYRLDVTNTGNGNVNDVEVRDTLPEHFSAGGRFTGNHCGTVDLDTFTDILRSGTIVSLGSGDTCEIYITGIVTRDDYSTLGCDYRYVNTGFSEYDNVISTGTVSATFLDPDIEITKTFTQDEIQVGETGSFTIILTNHGPGNAYGLEITDELQDGLSYLSSTPSASVNSDTLTWSNVDVPAGETWTATVVVEGTDDAIPAGAETGEVCNTGFVNDYDACHRDDNYLSGSDCVIISDREGELHVEKMQAVLNTQYCNDVTDYTTCRFTGNNIVVQEDDIMVYQITYENIDTDPIPEFRLVDTYPHPGFAYGGWTGTDLDGNLTFVGHDDGSHQLRWTGTDLEGGSGGILYITGEITSTNVNYYLNQIEAPGTGDDVTAYPADVNIIKTQRNITSGHEDPTDGEFIEGDIMVYSGDTINYRLQRYNYTQAPVDIVLRDIFPAGIEDREYSIAPDGDCGGNPANCRHWDLGEQPSGASGYIYITGIVQNTDGYAQYINTGQILYDGNTGEDTVVAYPYRPLVARKAQRNRTTNSGGNFSLSQHPDIVVFSGDIVEYQLYIENPYNYTATMSVTDLFPHGFQPIERSTFVGGTLHDQDAFPSSRGIDQYTDDGYKYWTWDLVLEAGQTGYVYITGQIINTDEYSRFVNTGQFLCMDEDGNYCGDEEDEVVAVNAQFTFRKNMSPNPVPEGQDTVDFKLCFQNNGADPMNEYEIIDFLPHIMSYQEGSAYYSYRNSSGDVLSGDISDPPTITEGSGYDEYLRVCDDSTTQDHLEGTPICPLYPGDLSGGCIHFQANLEY